MIANADVWNQFEDGCSSAVLRNHSQIVIPICDLGCIPFHLKRGLRYVLILSRKLCEEKPGPLLGWRLMITKMDLSLKEPFSAYFSINDFHSLQCLSFPGTLDEN